MLITNLRRATSTRIRNKVFNSMVMIPKNLTYKQLLIDMKNCEQTAGMSVAKHGDLVREYYLDLYYHLAHEDCDVLQYEWKLPKWVYENKSLLVNESCHDYTMQEYLLMHDCGKPYCRTVDENGKQHFEDHANVSYEVYKKLFPEKKTICELIKMDMDIHYLKDEGVKEFSQHPLALSLLLAGLSEIHANASMFGGIESTSFKIKWKQIDRRGRAIIENLPNR